MKLKEYLQELSYPRINPGENDKKYTIDVTLFSDHDIKDIKKILSKTLKRLGKTSRINIIQKL